MSDSQEHGQESPVEGASGAADSPGLGAPQAALQEEENSASTSKATDEGEVCEDEPTSGSEDHSQGKNKKVSFHPTPIVISESEKEWDSSSKGSSETRSSDSPSGQEVGLPTNPSARLAALHFRSREFLESQGFGDFTSDETSGDSEGSDNIEVMPEVSLDELQKLKAHSLCKGYEQLREKDTEIVQKCFCFAKFKLLACFRRTFSRCNRELSTYEDLTKNMLERFRDLFVILCIQTPLAERTDRKFTEIGSKLVEEATAKGVAAFYQKFSDDDPSQTEPAIGALYSDTELSFTKQINDMEKAKLDASTESASASTSN